MMGLFRLEWFGRFFLGMYRLAGRVEGRVFTRLIAGSFMALGRRTTIRRPVMIWGEQGIAIGSKVHIGPGCWLINLGKNPNGEPPRIRIGDGCSFAGGVTVTAVAGVWIGAEVLIGRNVHISDHSHEFGAPGTPVIGQGIGRPQPVRIGDGAWLGQGVVVCPGVSIGRGSVVGANSVVKSDIPDRCVAAGAPARVVRRLDT